MVDNDALTARVRTRRGNLAATFDAVCAVLTARGYLAGGDDSDRAADSAIAEARADPAVVAVGADPAGERVTDDGRRLSRLWSESDLLVAECLRQGLWAGLSAADLAAAVSVLVYESRRPEDAGPRVPGGAVADAVDATYRLWADLADDEREHGLSPTRQPDSGFAWPVHKWARGERLDRVLVAGTGPDPLPAGDFVRWCRQLVDLLDQIAAATAGTPLGRTARGAIEAVRRGVVAYSELS